MNLKQLSEKHDFLKIELSKKSISYLKKQNIEVRSRIFTKIDFALDNPSTIIRLKGKPIKYKIRVGDIRIILIFIKIPKGIKILEIGNRGEIYKRLA